jgi:hypothetical protein
MSFTPVDDETYKRGEKNLRTADGGGQRVRWEGTIAERPES